MTHEQATVMLSDRQTKFVEYTECCENYIANLEKRIIDQDIQITKLTKK